VEDVFDGLDLHPVAKPALGGLVIGLFGVAGLPHVFGVGYEFITEALRGELPLMLMGALIVAKIIGTSATLGSGGSGGILAPSLFLGAMLGGVVWNGAHALTPGVVTANYGAYALVGMAAVVASATRAPLQAILILFELTGGYEVILPLMLSSIIAVIVGHRLMEESIYTVKLRARGILLRQGQEVNVLRGIRVSEVMQEGATTVPFNMRLRPLLDLVSETSMHSSIFVVDEHDRIKGYITYQEIRRVLFDVESLEAVIVAGDITNLDVRSVTPADSLDVVMRLFAQKNQDELPVVDPEEPGRIIGSIHRGDVVNAYNNEILKRDLLGSMESGYEAVRRARTTSLGPGYTMAEVEVPSHFVGKDLRSLDLRNREGIEIILVRRRSPEAPGKTENVMPSAELVLRHGDVILVSGPQRVIERMTKG